MSQLGSRSRTIIICLPLLAGDAEFALKDIADGE